MASIKNLKKNINLLTYELLTEVFAFKHFHPELSEKKLIKVESSILVYKYHFNKEPKMAYVFVVTKKGFPEFMKKNIKFL